MCVDRNDLVFVLLDADDGVHCRGVCADKDKVLALYAHEEVHLLRCRSADQQPQEGPAVPKQAAVSRDCAMLLLLVKLGRSAGAHKEVRLLPENLDGNFQGSCDASERYSKHDRTDHKGQEQRMHRSVVSGEVDVVSFHVM